MKWSNFFRNPLPAYDEEWDRPNSCGLKTIGPNLTFQATKEHPENQIKKKGKDSPPGGLEPPTFRLTAERAGQLRHGGFLLHEDSIFLQKLEKANKN